MRGLMILCLCVCLTGCAAKLKFDETNAVTANAAWTKITEKFSKETKVKVEATSSDAAFHIFVLKASDVTEANETLMQKTPPQAPPGVLGHQLNTKNASFDVTAPAGSELQFYVIPVGAKATVTVKMNSL